MKKALAIIGTLLIAVAITTGCGDTSSLTDNPESSQSSILSNESTIPDTVSSKVSSSDRASSVSIEDLWDDVSSSDESSAAVTSKPAKASIAESPSSVSVELAPSSEKATSSHPASSEQPVSTESSTGITSSSQASQVPLPQVESTPPASSDGQSYDPIAYETQPEERVVYWGESGTKYHIDPNCRSFKGNTPHSGSIDDAIAAGRTGWCGICSKGMK